MKQENNENNKIEQIVIDAMEKLKAVIDVNTVIGSPIISAERTTIIPISKVTAGFIAGGGEYNQTKDMKKNCSSQYPFAGGSGSGFSINPIGFLIETKKGIQFVHLNDKTNYEKILEIVKNITDKMRKWYEKNIVFFACFVFFFSIFLL